MHKRGVRRELLTGICSAFGDGEVRAWAPRSALIALLAFPTVWACRVVLTLTGQLAVVVRTRGGVQITFAPGQRRDKSALSVTPLSAITRLHPPVSWAVALTPQGLSATCRLWVKGGFAAPP